MLRKVSGLGLIVALVAIGFVIAAPSQRPSATHHPSLSAMDKLPIHPGSYAVKPDGSTPQLVYPAWNYAHLYACQMTVPGYKADGTPVGTGLVMAANTDIGIIFITDVTQFQNMLAAGCETDNYIGVYIYDQYADWNGIQTYSWK